MSSLTGTGTLLRFAARRDRVLIPIALVALTALSVGSAQATIGLYPSDEAAREGLGSVLSNPSFVAMYGPIGAENLDALSVFKTLLMGAVFVALMAYAVVRRHTRVEEELGRSELVSAQVVGRRAPLTAAMILAGVAVVAASVLSTVGLIAVGLDVRGSIAFGAAWTIAGAAMIGVTAVAAQLTTSARACAGISLGALGVMFLLRAVGDTTGGSAAFLSWLSPLGWVSKVGVYGPNRFWVLGPALLVSAALVGLAYSLLDRRDVGAGLVPARPGPATAHPSLGTPLGLTWRLNRPSAIGWLAAFVILGVVVGGLVSSVADMASDPSVVDMLRKLGGSAGTITDIFLATELAFIAVAAAAAGITLALRLSSEERTGRAELVLATATSRPSWLGAHAVQAFVLPVVLVVALGSVVAAVAGGAAGTPGFGGLVGAALAHVPAIAIMVAIALLAAAALPTWSTAIGWGALGVAFALGELGATVGLPDWLIDVSPFAHVPQLPGGTFTWTPSVVMLAIAAVVTLAAFVTYRQRDVV